MWTHPEAHPGEYLQTRFLEPLDLTPAELARRCRIPRSRVSDLLTGKRRITADTAKRLAAVFRMDPQAWLALQAAWDLQHAAGDPAIVPRDPPGFLVGPAGATPLRRPRRPSRPALRVPDGHEAPRTPEGGAEARQRSQHQEVQYADGTRALVAKPT